QDASAAFVGEAEDAVFAHGFVDRFGDVLSGFATFQYKFPRCMLHTDLDLHGHSPYELTTAAQGYLSAPQATPRRRRVTVVARYTPSVSGWSGNLEMPRQVSFASSSTASSFGTARFVASQLRAAISAAPVRPIARRSARSRSTPVSAMIVSAIAWPQSCATR